MYNFVVLSSAQMPESTLEAKTRGRRFFGLWRVSPNLPVYLSKSTSFGRHYKRNPSKYVTNSHLDDFLIESRKKWTKKVRKALHHVMRISSLWIHTRTKNSSGTETGFLQCTTFSAAIDPHRKQTVLLCCLDQSSYNFLIKTYYEDDKAFKQHSWHFENMLSVW